MLISMWYSRIQKEEISTVSGYLSFYFSRLTSLSHKDRLQDLIVAARCCPHDRRDCQQWHAIPALLARGGGARARNSPHRVSWGVWTIHQLDLDSVQIEASRGYVFIFMHKVRSTKKPRSPQHGRRRYDSLRSLRPGTSLRRHHHLRRLRHRRATSSGPNRPR